MTKRRHLGFLVLVRWIHGKHALAYLINFTSAFGNRLDRVVFPENIKHLTNSPKGDNTPALDQPGLKDMTIKAIDILQERSRKKKSGWFLMSEAASVDKVYSDAEIDSQIVSWRSGCQQQMHALDYDRALGELLELDDTISKTIDRMLIFFPFEIKVDV
jgi:alkaline phosphatase